MRPMRRIPPAFWAAFGLIGTPLVFHMVISVLEHHSVDLSLFGICKVGVVFAAALAHWLLYAGLTTTFAMTLRPGRTPLVTEMAHRLHGQHIARELERYTRHVTIAWTVFFLSQMALSICLFCFASLKTWSFFVNIVDLPSVAAFFALEYVVRQFALENPPKHSLSQIITMIKDCASRPAPATKPRSS